MPYIGGPPFRAFFLMKWVVGVWRVFKKLNCPDPFADGEGQWAGGVQPGEDGPVQSSHLAGQFSQTWPCQTDHNARYWTVWRGSATGWSPAAASSRDTPSSTPRTWSGPSTRPGRTGRLAAPNDEMSFQILLYTCLDTGSALMYTHTMPILRNFKSNNLSTWRVSYPKMWFISKAVYHKMYFYRKNFIKLKLISPLEKVFEKWIS